MGLASGGFPGLVAPLPSCKQPVPKETSSRTGESSALRSRRPRAYRALPAFPTGLLLPTGQGSVSLLRPSALGVKPTLSSWVSRPCPPVWSHCSLSLLILKVPTRLGPCLSLGHAKPFPIAWDHATLWLAPSLLGPGSHVTP